VALTTPIPSTAPQNRASTSNALVPLTLTIPSDPPFGKSVPLKTHPGQIVPIIRSDAAAELFGLCFSSRESESVAFLLPGRSKQKRPDFDNELDALGDA
jgi:hypothetical protein